MKKIILASILFLLFIGFDAQSAHIEYSRNGISVDIKIEGKIEKGDYFKFEDVSSRAFVEATAVYELSVKSLKENNEEKYRGFVRKFGVVDGAISVTVLLNSNGGDITESIQIGRAIRSMAQKTEVDVDSKCISACFFIWASGIERSAKSGNNSTIGIHRVFYDKNYFANLTSTQAEAEYQKIKDISKKYLDEMGVPLIKSG